MSFEFTLRDEAGIVIDSNVGKQPMSFKSGLDEMLPALEDELLLLEVGEEKSVILPVEKAYGEIKKEKFGHFPVAAIPEKARRPGHKIMARTPEGQDEMVEVVEVNDDSVVVDFNHPLAGMVLQFDVKIISKALL